MVRMTALVVALVAVASVARADDVLRKSTVARHNMRQLQTAYNIYWNNSGTPPSDPALLYPEHVRRARTFWHPGDSDPRPTTINNSEPNAPHSARISFEWDLSAHLPADAVFLRDNTPANNAGRFLNLLTVDGVFETDPPLATPTPTKLALARSHLRRLAVAVQIYMNDNADDLPDDLIRFWDDGSLVSPRTFWNPGDADRLPADITNSAPNAPDSTQVSFEYLGAGLTGSELTPDLTVLRDWSVENNSGYGQFVVWGDFSTEFVPDCPGDVTGDNRVTDHDLRVVLRHLPTISGANPEDGDTDGDDDVDFRDLRAVMAHLGDDCTTEP